MAGRMKNASRRRGRGAILVIVSLLIGSVALRVGANAEDVLDQVGLNDGRAPVATQGKPQQTEFPDKAALQKMLDGFLAREKIIKKQEMELAERARVLEASNRQLAERLVQLEAAEEKLRSTLALASSAAENDLARLTAVYENMKPAVAAALFQEMDAQFAAGFLGRMRPDAAAAVMAGMTPEKAYSVSAILAGRNANVPLD